MSAQPNRRNAAKAIADFIQNEFFNMRSFEVDGVDHPVNCVEDGSDVTEGSTKLVVYIGMTSYIVEVKPE